MVRYGILFLSLRVITTIRIYCSSQKQYVLYTNRMSVGYLAFYLHAVLENTYLPLFIYHRAIHQVFKN